MVSIKKFAFILSVASLLGTLVVDAKPDAATNTENTVNTKKPARIGGNGIVEIGVQVVKKDKVIEPTKDKIFMQHPSSKELTVTDMKQYISKTYGVPANGIRIWSDCKELTKEAAFYKTYYVRFNEKNYAQFKKKADELAHQVTSGK